MNAELVGSHVSEHMKVLLVLAVGYLRGDAARLLWGEEFSESR